MCAGNLDTEVYAQLIYSRFAQVAVSRASHEAQIHTNDQSILTKRLSRDASKTSALQSIGSSAEHAQGKLKQVPNGLGLSLLHVPTQFFQNCRRNAGA